MPASPQCFIRVNLMEPYVDAHPVMRMPEGKPKGKMTVEEAGHKGGQKERKLVEEGRRAEEKGERSRK